MFLSWRFPRLSARKNSRSSRGGKQAKKPSCRLHLEYLEDRIVPATRTWDGGSLTTNQWTDRFNWDSDVAPLSNDVLIFPAVAAQKINKNNFADATSFGQINFSGTGYTITGSRITLGAAGIIDSSATVGTNNFGIALVLSGTAASVQNLTVNTPGEILKLTGSLEGAPSLLKIGPGTVQLGGVNSFTGTMTINDGILAVLNSAALGSTAAGTVVNAGGSLEIGPVAVSGEALTLSGLGFLNTGALRSANVSGASAWAGNITLASNTRVQVENGFGLTLSGTIGGSGNLTKGGSNTLILSHANTYTGTTFVNNGTLEIRDGAALGSTAAGTEVASGGTLALNGGIQVTGETLTLRAQSFGNRGLRSVSGDNLWDGPVVVPDAIPSDTPDIVVASGQLTISGIISGAGGFIKEGAGKLILTRANTFSGGTAVFGGTMTLRNNNALGGTTGLNLDGDAALELDAGITVIGISLGMGAGGTTANRGGTLRSLAGANSFWTGDITLVDNCHFDVETTGGLILTGVIKGGLLDQLIKTGAGTLILTGSNNYSGLTSVLAGTLRFTTSAGLGTAEGGTLVASGGTLELNGGNILINESLTLNGAGVANAGVLVSVGTSSSISGAINLAGDSTINLPVGSLLLKGGIAGGGFGIIKIGAGTLSFTGATANTYTGTTTLKEGNLVLGKTAGVTAVPGPLVIGDGTANVNVRLATSDQIADTAPVTVTRSLSGTAVLQLDNNSDRIGALTLLGGAVTTTTGTLGLNGDVIKDSFLFATISGKLDLGAATRTFTVASGGIDDLIIDAVISGAAGSGITKLGPGVLSLVGANTYSGLTSVNVGTLQVANGSALGTFANATQGTTVAAGAALRMKGANVGSEPLTLNGFGVSNSGALFNFFSGNNSWGGPITLASSTAIGVFTGGTLTISGAISGPFGITKLGLGQLRFTGASANTYTGATLVNEGILALVKSPGVTAVPGNLVIGDGIGTDTDVVAILADNQIADGGAVTINATGRLEVYLTEAIGPLTMNSGLILTQLTVDPVTGVPKFSTLTLTSDVTVNAVPTAATPTALIVGVGSLNLGGATRTFTVADTIADPLVPELAISIPISGAAGAGITKQGAGLMELSAANSYSGPTIVAAGQLNVRSATALGTTAGNTTVQSGATLLFGGNSGASLTVNEPLVLSGILASAAGSQTWSGPIIFSGTPTLSVGGFNTMFLTGVLSGTGNVTKLGGGTTEYGGTAANTHSGSTLVKEGTLFLNKTAAVTSIAGPLLVGDGSADAKVQLKTSDQIGDGVPVTVTGSESFSSILFLDQQSDRIGSLTMTAGAANSSTGTLGLNGNVTILPSSRSSQIVAILDLGAATRIFQVADGSADIDLILDALIKGNAGVGLTKLGAGSVWFDGTSGNTFTGATTVNEGAVFFNKTPGANTLVGPLVIGDGVGLDRVVFLAGDQIIDTAPVTVNSSGVLDLNNRSDKIASLTMTGGLVTTGTGTLTLNGNVTTNAAAASATINGNLNLGAATRTFTTARGILNIDLAINALISAAPGVGLVKNGAGTLQLTNNNDYAGPTTLNQGNLLVDGTQPLSPVTSTFGGTTLGGRGTTGAATLVGTLSPGDPTGLPGALTVGTLVLNSNAIFDAQLNNTVPVSGYDVLNVSGLVNLGNSSLAISCVFTPHPGDTFLILQNDASDPITGTFKSLLEGATFVTGTNQYRITYLGGDGNDIVVTYLNTAPMITDVTLTPALDEGGTATLTGRLVDPNPGDVLRLDINWGDGSTTDTIFPGLAPFSVSHQYLDSGNFAVHFVWSDDKGGFNERTLPVTVRNVAPTLSGMTVSASGTSVLLSGAITDPGLLDTFTLTITWGDGATNTYTFAAGTTSFSLTHEYQKPGNRLIQLALEDDDGGADSAALRAMVHANAHANQSSGRLDALIYYFANESFAPWRAL